jgi:hypothetical protein
LQEIAMMAGSTATTLPVDAGIETHGTGNTECDPAKSVAMLSAVPSPCTPNGGRSMSTEKMDATGKTSDGRKHSASLEHAVKFSSVPTPMAGTPAQNGYNGAGSTDYERKMDVALGLRETINAPKLATVSTPSSRDWKDSPGMSESGVDPDGSIRSRLDQLPRQAQLADSGVTATGGTGKTGSTGQLAPDYSRWLQGLPPEWCDCAVMATRSTRKSRKHSSKPTSK